MQKFAFIFDLIEFLTVGSVWYLLFFLINQLSITDLLDNTQVAIQKSTIIVQNKIRLLLFNVTDM
jgi:hypothetical protein